MAQKSLAQGFPSRRAKRSRRLSIRCTIAEERAVRAVAKHMNLKKRYPNELLRRYSLREIVKRYHALVA